MYIHGHSGNPGNSIYTDSRLPPFGKGGPGGDLTRQSALSPHPGTSLTPDKTEEERFILSNPPQSPFVKGGNKDTHIPWLVPMQSGLRRRPSCLEGTQRPVFRALANVPVNDGKIPSREGWTRWKRSRGVSGGPTGRHNPFQVFKPCNPSFIRVIRDSETRGTACRTLT
jgi:hypothetical protein